MPQNITKIVCLVYLESLKIRKSSKDMSWDLPNLGILSLVTRKVYSPLYILLSAKS